MYFIGQGLLVKITGSQLKKKKKVTPLETSKLSFEAMSAWRLDEGRTEKELGWWLIFDQSGFFFPRLGVDGKYQNSYILF